MAIPAGECASRSSQIKPTNRASQQPVTGTRYERRHRAAPPARRTGNMPPSQPPLGCGRHHSRIPRVRKSRACGSTSQARRPPNLEHSAPSKQNGLQDVVIFGFGYNRFDDDNELFVSNDPKLLDRFYNLFKLYRDHYSERISFTRAA